MFSPNGTIIPGDTWPSCPLNEISEKNSRSKHLGSRKHASRPCHEIACHCMTISVIFLFGWSPKSCISLMSLRVLKVSAVRNEKFELALICLRYLVQVPVRTLTLQRRFEMLLIQCRINWPLRSALQLFS